MNTFLNFSRARWAPSMAVRKSLAAVTLLGLVAGCSVLPKPPSRVDIFDFGPGLTKTAEASQPATPLPPIALADFTSAGVPDGRSALFYRLAYSNAQMLYPYTQARWSQPPTTLMQLAVRDRLGVRRSVIYGDQNIDQQIKGGQSPTVLRAEVEEFSQVFQSEKDSVGLVRVRVSMVDSLKAGDELIDQRVFVAQRPAPTPDAAGGAKALSDAAAQDADEIAQWVEQSKH